jgi:hypothetical protein
MIAVKPSFYGCWVLVAVAAWPAAGLAEPSAAPVEPVADQEVGARVGVRMGGRTTPGGLSVGGSYLYRATESVWFDSGVAFILGAGGSQCFRDRDNAVQCDHSQLDGHALGAHTGIRWVARENQGFVPYARGTIGIEVVRFADDDVSGVAVPLGIGVGLRARVDDRIAVGGGADLSLGVGKLSRVGAEPQLALAVQFGVEFAL